MESFLNKVEASIIEVMNSYLRKTTQIEGSFFEWDGNMKKEWEHLINPPLLYERNDLKARKECVWNLPQKDG